MHVRPDGAVVVVTDDRQVEVFDVADSALADQTWDVDPAGWVSVHDGLAAAVNPALQQAEVIDLSTGERSTIDLTAPDGEPFHTLLLYPETSGAWAVSLDHVAARWEDGQMVEQVYLGSGEGVTGIRSGRSISGTRHGNHLAVLGHRTDGSQEATLVSLEPGRSGVAMAVPTFEGTVAHPSLEGGLHVASVNGVLRTYDATGAPIGEIQSGATDPAVITIDAATGKLALDSRDGGVSIVDPASGEIVQVDGVDRVVNLGFARDGELLAIVQTDGTVRLWDVEQETFAGLIWDGAGALEGEPPWYDETTGSLWIYSSAKVINIPLSPERWVTRACEIVGRDLTQDEWDRLVPGDEPRQSACG